MDYLSHFHFFSCLLLACLVAAAISSIQELISLGRELGLESDELCEFASTQQADQREEFQREKE